MNSASTQTLTPLQAALAAAVCGGIAGGLAYLETRVIVLAILGGIVTAVALAIWIPRQPITVRGKARSRPIPRGAVASTGLLLALGAVLAVWLSDWVIAAAAAGAAAFWLALALLGQRR